MTAVLAMLALAACCWAYRLLFVVVVPASRLPAGARVALTHLGPAVLASIVVTESATTAATGSPATAGLVLLAVGAMALTAYCTRSLTLTTVVAVAAALLLDLM